MNRWRVKWKAQALRDMTSIWNQAHNKTQVTKAAHQLEESLKRNPMTFGESRGGLRRMAFEKPLCIIFELIPDDEKVMVINVLEW
ncbi:MAG: hypothetical protein QM703_19020 [Gemmatales bacterium]